MNKLYKQKILQRKRHSTVLNYYFDNYNNLFSRKCVAEICNKICSCEKRIYNTMDDVGCCFSFLVNLLSENLCVIYCDDSFDDKTYKAIWILEKDIFILSYNTGLEWAENIPLSFYYRSTEKTAEKIHHLQSKDGV